MPAVNYKPYLEASRQRGNRFRQAVAGYKSGMSQSAQDAMTRGSYQDKPIRQTEALIDRMLDDLSLRDPGGRSFSQSFRRRQRSKAGDMVAQQQLQRAAAGGQDVDDINLYPAAGLGDPSAGADPRRQKGFIQNYLSAPGGRGGMTLGGRQDLIQTMIGNITAGAQDSDDAALSGLAQIFDANPYLLGAILQLAFPGQREQELIMDAVGRGFGERELAYEGGDPVFDWINYILNELPTQPFDLPGPDPGPDYDMAEAEEPYVPAYSEGVWDPILKKQMNLNPSGNGGTFDPNWKWKLNR